MTITYEDFDYNKYLQMYQDVNKSISNDNRVIALKDKVWEHWTRHGSKEGRTGYTYSMQTTIPLFKMQLDNLIFDNFYSLKIEYKEANIEEITIDSFLPPSWHGNYENENNMEYNPIIRFNNSPLENNKIPKKIHKCFINSIKDDIPKEILDNAINTWKQYYPDYELVIYDSNDIEEYILTHYCEDLLTIYNSLIPNAFKCDLFRVLVLYNEGGIYSDLKQSISKRIIDFDDYNLVYVIERHHEHRKLYHPSFDSIQNCFIACTPKHPYIKSYMDIIIQNIINIRYGINDTDITGPTVYGKAIHNIRKKWKYYDKGSELELYFNNNDSKNGHIICDRNNELLINHKYDNKNIIYNNNITYQSYWRYNNVFHKVRLHPTKIIESDINFIDEFSLIIESEKVCYNIEFESIIEKNKLLTTYFFIKRNHNKFNIYINNDYKVEKQYSEEEIHSYIEINKHKINRIYSKTPVISIDVKTFVFKNKNKYKKQNNNTKSKIDFFPIYFPQFHNIKENNINFWNGYTDIENLKLFKYDGKDIDYVNGVSQNKLLPGIQDTLTPNLKELEISDISDYNLENNTIMQNQFNILNNYNLSGFAVYYYWHSKNTITNEHMIMKKIVDKFFDKSLELHDKKVFFIWANENWSGCVALADLKDKNIIANEYNKIEYEKNASNLIDYFKNENYLKIENKPVFFMYHPFFLTLDELNEFKYILEMLCMENGFDGVHFVLNSNTTNKGYESFKNTYINLNYKNENIACRQFCNDRKRWIVDFYEYVNSNNHFKTDQINTIMFDFDNRVRLYKPNRTEYSTLLINVSEFTQKLFLNKILSCYNNRSGVDNICLINSWNEWGEKLAIEPSEEEGYRYLNMLMDQIMQFNY